MSRLPESSPGPERPPTPEPGAPLARRASATTKGSARSAGATGSKPSKRRKRPAEPSDDERGGAQMHEHRLRNGLRVLIAERHADPVVAVLLYYRVGALNESAERAGVSHFLEHMMFKGSKRFGKGEVDRMCTELGGSNNAFTGYDHTAYWFEFASDRWERALEIEADRMRNLTLDADEFASERDVVLEELSMGEDDPWRVLARRVEQKLCERHPYGRPIIGYRDTLEALDVDAMRDHYQSFYHPGNATLIVAGDVRPKAALKAIREHLGDIPAGPKRESVDPPRPPMVEVYGEVRLSMNWPDEGQRLLMLWPGAACGGGDDYALDYVVTALTGGRNARLQRQLVHDSGLAVYVTTSNDARVEGGFFWLMAEASPGVAPEDLERAIDAALESLVSEGLTDEEYQRAQAMLLASEAYDSETVSGLAEELGGWAVDADWRHALDRGYRHGQVDPDQIREVAARLLDRDRRVVGWCLPEAANGAES